MEGCLVMHVNLVTAFHPCYIEFYAAEFAKACGEYARNDAFRSLNETIIANVGRDRDKGARFARVPTGFETCTFCLMLASRGAVYHTRKSAGEWKHFHRGCDCKVVPSFERDPYVEVVEGVKPRELQERWKQLKDIDETEGLSAEQKDARKRKILNLAEARSNPSTRYRAENLDLSELEPGELRKMQKKNPLEWESYVHLSRLGFRQRLLHEQGNATANIDIALYLDDTWSYWDMKTIEGGVHAIKKRMTECHSKWVRLSSKEAVLPEGIDIDLLDAPRVVIDNRFSKISDAEAEEQIRKSKDFLSGRDGFSFAQALLICKKRNSKDNLIKKTVPTPDRAQGGTAKQLHYTTSGRGGTGRRASFRGWRASARAGSNPAAPTTFDHGRHTNEARPRPRSLHPHVRGERRRRGRRGRHGDGVLAD